MTFYLPSDPPTRAPNPAPREDAGTMEVLGAAWTAESIETDAWGRERQVRQSILQEIEDRIGGFEADTMPAPDAGFTPFTDAAAPEQVTEEIVAPPSPWGRSEREERALLARASRFAARNPADYGGLPLDPDQLQEEVNRRQKAELDDAYSVLQVGGAVPEFLGRGARATTDEFGLAFALIGGGTGSLARVAGREALLGGASEAMILPRMYDVAERLDIPDPDPLAQIALAAGFSGAFGLGIEAARRGLALTFGRSAHESAAVPGADPYEVDAAINAAEAAIRQDLPVQAAPSDWEAIKAGIFAGESNGDYDALFGFSNRPGGPFASVRLTEMTVDEALAFSDPRGPYATWVRGQVGRVATPMGAYQVVGTTLRAAKRGLGLTGAERMTPEMQDRIGQWILRTQGTGAWEGYRGPGVPGTGVADDMAAPFRGGTRRGYTAPDEVVTPECAWAWPTRSWMPPT
jgi:hypothetical protein